jgi:RNA polymerase sigma factor (sigma-70 family)
LSPLALSLRFLQTQPDARLAALAAAGHERAFEALVRRYRRELLAYCRRVGSVGTNAEDTLQQALLQAWTAIRTGVEVRDPRAWLYRIVHNVAVSNHRRPVIVPVEMRDTAGENGADHEAEQRMAARAALASLAALPDLQREVMVGTAVDGMSHEELASALGLSSGAVRGLIYRARATLRAAAAAITPGPLISWALRSGSGPGSAFYEALAGSGTAGIGGILIKGGAIAATAGAIATATGISTTHKSNHHRATAATAAIEHRVVGRPAAASVTSSRVLVADPTSSQVGDRGGSGQHESSEGPGSGSGSGDDHGFASVGGGRGPGDHDGDGRGGSDRGDHGGSAGPGSRGSGHGESHEGPGSGDHGSGDDGSGSGRRGSGGSDSGSATTPSGGSGSDDPGGELSGKDGGSSGGTSGTSGGSGSSGGGSGSSGSGSGSSGGGGSLSSGGSILAPTVTSDDGDGGSGHDGATTTTTTTATATTSGDDGSSESGHHGGK